MYLPASVNLTTLPAGKEVRVLSMDKRAAKTWNGFSSLAQDVCRSLRDTRVVREPERPARQLRAGTRMGPGR